MRRLSISTILMGVLFMIFSCSSDRVEPNKPGSTPNDEETEEDEEQIEVSSSATAALQERLRSTPTTKTITSYSDLPFIGAQGTKIWAYPYNFEDSEGNIADYPIEIELLEIYTPGDMIANNVPTTSGGKILSSGGAFRVRAFKNGEQLQVRDGRDYDVTVPSDSPDDEMELFTGGNEDELSDWSPLQAPDSALIASQVEYALSLSDIGWINIDHFMGSDISTVDITVESNNAETEGLATYLYLEGINSIMNGVIGKTFPLPQGEEITIVAFGADGDNHLYFDVITHTANENETIQIALEEVSEEELNDLLDSL